MEKTREINLQEIIYAILNRIWLVILAAVVCGVAMNIYTAKFITPMYRSSVTLYVNNSTKFIDGETEIEKVDRIASSDLATSERLVTTYVTILESNTVLSQVSDKVYEETGTRVYAGDIRSAMSAGAVNETEVFRVAISHANPKMAAVIANAIAKVAEEGALASIVEGSSTKVVDWATVASAPYAPNGMRNTILGVAGGILLAVAFIVLTVLMDVRVRSEEDLARLSEAPVLGVIPNFEVESEKGYTYASKKDSEISGEQDADKADSEVTK